MSFRDLGLGFVAGLLVAAVAWGLAHGEGVPVSITTTARAATCEEVTCPPFPDCVTSDAGAVIAAQDRQIRDLSDRAFGRPLVWPDPDDAASVEASLHEALETCEPGARLLDTDCSEPPCVALLAVDGDAQLSDLCPDLEWSGRVSANVPCPDGRHQAYAIRVGNVADHREANTVEGLDFGRNVGKRFETRAEDLMGAFECP